MSHILIIVQTAVAMLQYIQFKHANQRNEIRNIAKLFNGIYAMSKPFYRIYVLSLIGEADNRPSGMQYTQSLQY